MQIQEVVFVDNSRKARISCIDTSTNVFLLHKHTHSPCLSHTYLLHSKFLRLTSSYLQVSVSQGRQLLLQRIAIM